MGNSPRAAAIWNISASGGFWCCMTGKVDGHQPEGEGHHQKQRLHQQRQAHVAPQEAESYHSLTSSPTTPLWEIRSSRRQEKDWYQTSSPALGYSFGKLVPSDMEAHSSFTSSRAGQPPAQLLRNPCWGWAAIQTMNYMCLANSYHKCLAA